ncbi:hypothetical protein IFT48_03190 [Pseudomonas fluorescens]|uniref:hypothetical protein n=1 Tax=Pseudomonas fluorescens TaxID=294 RepID=UPI0019308CBA|nr:hypothetical protein [Pseudomonas fluorescens]MBD8088973.1 hypothetical protein [Pseudomonas fluorescens]
MLTEDSIPTVTLPEDFQALRSFVSTSHTQSVSRAQIDIGGIQVYVRMTSRVLGNQWIKTLDLADITVPTNLRGQRLFSQVLKEFERLGAQYNRSVYVESIINPIIREALIRRGYTLRESELDSAWKTPECPYASSQPQGNSSPKV